MADVPRMDYLWDALKDYPIDKQVIWSKWWITRNTPFYMSLKALWQYCHTWITYRSTCRVTLMTTDHVTWGTIAHMWLRYVQWMTNIWATETCMMNTHAAQTHVWLLQMIDLASMKATQSCATMKLPIKQYETHTNNKNTWGNCSHVDINRTTPRSFKSRQIWLDPSNIGPPGQFLHWWYLPKWSFVPQCEE